MKYCLYNCFETERQELENKGLYVYDLRLDDNCCEIATIEPHVWVNNGGNIVTNERIIFTKGLSHFHDEDNFEDFEEFCNSNEQVENINDLLRG